MTGSGTSGGGASLSAAMTIRLLPIRRKPRLLASRMKRRASSQVTSASRTVIWPFTEESVTMLKPHSLARALSTSESSALRRSMVILPVVAGAGGARGPGGAPPAHAAGGGAPGPADGHRDHAGIGLHPNRRHTRRRGGDRRGGPHGDDRGQGQDQGERDAKSPARGAGPPHGLSAPPLRYPNRTSTRWPSSIRMTRPSFASTSSTRILFWIISPWATMYTWPPILSIATRPVSPRTPISWAPADSRVGGGGGVPTGAGPPAPGQSGGGGGAGGGGPPARGRGAGPPGAVRRGTKGSARPAACGGGGGDAAAGAGGAAGLGATRRGPPGARVGGDAAGGGGR